MPIAEVTRSPGQGLAQCLHLQNRGFVQARILTRRESLLRLKLGDSLRDKIYGGHDFIAVETDAFDIVEQAQKFLGTDGNFAHRQMRRIMFINLAFRALLLLFAEIIID